MVGNKKSSRVPCAQTSTTKHHLTLCGHDEPRWHNMHCESEVLDAKEPSLIGGVRASNNKHHGISSNNM